MKSALYVCIKNPFTQRDLGRLGIEALERHFELRILDCTPWLMPAAYRSRGSAGLARPNLRVVRSLREFKDALGKARGGVAIDYVGQFSPSSILMFEALRTRGIKLVVLDSGAFPLPRAPGGARSIVAKIFHTLRQGGVRQHLNARINRLFLACLPDQRPDLALVSGSSWRQDPRFAQARRQVEAHSFDYERYREVNAARPAGFSSVGPYAVYLDEDIAEHEDNLEMGMAAPASKRRFYPALTRLFERFEAESGMRVVVAGYPNRRRTDEGRFGGREVHLGHTAELIREASLVFAHASTAISFAVLWRRPLVFVTSEEIARSWYQPWIEAPCAVLRAPLINLDAGTRPSTAAASLNAAAYEQYQVTYIKSARSPEKSLWDIFVEGVATPSGIMASP